MRQIWLQFTWATLVLSAMIAVLSCADSATTAGSEPDDEADVGRSGVNVDDGPSVSHPALWESSLELVDVSAGEEHSCGLTDDGQIICWGLGGDEVKDERSYDYGQSYVPDNSDWKQVSAGRYFTCGIRLGDSLECWGQGSDPERDELHGDRDQATPPAGSYEFVSAGGASACALRTDDTWRCWGSDRDNLNELPDLKFVQISVGAGHVCGVTAAQNVACWGHGDEDDETVDELFTQAIPPPGAFTKVSAGWAHTCGLHTDGTVSCWGLGSDPQQAESDSLFAPLAVGQAIAPSGQFIDVSAGGEHTCGIRDDHTIECWGAGSTPFRAEPSEDFQEYRRYCGPAAIECNQSVAPPGRFKMVSAGGHHTCALRLDGRVVCWGANDDGQARPPSSERIAPEIIGAD